MPRLDVDHCISGSASRRRDLLRGARRPRDFTEYLQRLRKCEAMLHDEEREWEILDPCGRSYMRAIRHRRELLFGDVCWKDLEREPRQRLMGSRRTKDVIFWALLGPLYRTGWKAARDHQAETMPVLRNVQQARDTNFPLLAGNAMRKLLDEFNGLGPGTATLLLTLARPDRLLPVNRMNTEALAELSGIKGSKLCMPEGYRKLLVWLYRQPWYDHPRPKEEHLVRIWEYRAALVDAFVWDAP